MLATLAQVSLANVKSQVSDNKNMNLTLYLLADVRLTKFITLLSFSQRNDVNTDLW